MGEYQPAAYATLCPVASPNGQSLHQQRAGTQLNSKTQIFVSWHKLHADHAVQCYVAPFAVVSLLLRDRLIFR